MTQQAQAPKRLPPPPNGVSGGRLPATDLDAEAAVLSAAMLKPEAVVDDVRAILPAGAFWSDANKHIYEAILWCADNGVPIDSVNVASRLKDRGELQHIGGTTYLGQIIDATPAIVNVMSHAIRVRDLWRTRIAGALALKANVESYSAIGSGEDIQKWLEKIEAEFADIAHLRETKFLRPLGDVLQDVYQSVSNAYNNQGTGVGTPSGFTAIDKVLGSFRDGDLIILAGRPGQGKSGLGICCAINAGSKGFAVPIFSLEMPAEQVGMRILSAEARIDLARLRAGKINGSEFAKIAIEIQRLQQLPIWIDDTAGITPFEVRARVRRLQIEIQQNKHPHVTQNKIGLVVVDYLQLQSPAQPGRSREEEVANISKTSKEIAKQLGVPYMALSQLNRNPEKRTDKRPELADLRESGSLEADADVVMFVFRPEYYDKKSDPALKGWAEILVEKQRNGPTGKVRLAFRAEYARFDNFIEDEFDWDPNEAPGP